MTDRMKKTNALVLLAQSPSGMDCQLLDRGGECRHRQNMHTQCIVGYKGCAKTPADRHAKAGKSVNTFGEISDKDIMIA
jgi:hypothetical protein